MRIRAAQEFFARNWRWLAHGQIITADPFTLASSGVIPRPIRNRGRDSMLNSAAHLTIKNSAGRSGIGAPTSVTGTRRIVVRYPACAKPFSGSRAEDFLNR